MLCHPQDWLSRRAFRGVALAGAPGRLDASSWRLVAPSCISFDETGAWQPSFATHRSQPVLVRAVCSLVEKGLDPISIGQHPIRKTRVRLASRLASRTTICVYYRLAPPVAFCSCSKGATAAKFAESAFSQSSRERLCAFSPPTPAYLRSSDTMRCLAWRAREGSCRCRLVLL
jgi:hypothetical protein